MAEQERIENALSDEELDAVSGGQYVVVKAEGLVDKENKESVFKEMIHVDIE